MQREEWTEQEGWQDSEPYINGMRNDNVLNEMQQRSRRRRTKFRSSLADVVLSYSQQVRRYAKKTSSTSDLSMKGERFLFSVLAMLIGFVTFWMSFISAILNGSNLILSLLIAVLRTCGRSARRVWRNIPAS